MLFMLKVISYCEVCTARPCNVGCSQIPNSIRVTLIQQLPISAAISTTDSINYTDIHIIDMFLALICTFCLHKNEAPLP
jgi:hypothetical protein